MNLRNTNLNRDTNTTIAAFLSQLDDRVRISKNYAKACHAKAQFWEGRYHVLRHENNKLRKENERLRNGGGKP